MRALPMLARGSHSRESNERGVTQAQGKHLEARKRLFDQIAQRMSHRGAIAFKGNMINGDCACCPRCRDGENVHNSTESPRWMIGTHPEVPFVRRT